jgi:hypothetical protein
MSVQTYSPSGGMVLCVSGGQYVETRDYLAEKARADAAESEVERLRYQLTSIKSLTLDPAVRQAAKAALAAETNVRAIPDAAVEDRTQGGAI